MEYLKHFFLQRDWLPRQPNLEDRADPNSSRKGFLDEAGQNVELDVGELFDVQAALAATVHAELGKQRIVLVGEFGEVDAQFSFAGGETNQEDGTGVS